MGFIIYHYKIIKKKKNSIHQYTCIMEQDVFWKIKNKIQNKLNMIAKMLCFIR